MNRYSGFGSTVTGRRCTDGVVLAASLREVNQLQGQLLSKAGVINEAHGLKFNVDTLLKNIVQSSAIEGEVVDAESVRSSLAGLACYSRK